MAPHDDRKMSFLPTRRKSMHFAPSKNIRPRWILHLQAQMWRFLMSIGMLLHRLAPPHPPKPNFSRSIPSTISAKPGMIPLQFYVPPDYETQKSLWEHRPKLREQMKYRDEVSVPVVIEEDEEAETGPKESMGRRVSMTLDRAGQSLRRRSMNVRRWGHYPVIINFHGGGFTLGHATDDARWCGTVVDELNAVVISVDYRLAPECPFPTAVEDGADVVLWVHEHADELGIDREKIAISGFSSGANMAFTVPLRLYDEQSGFRRQEASPEDSRAKVVENTVHGSPSTVDSARVSSSSSTAVPSSDDIEMVKPIASEDSDAPPLSGARPGKVGTKVATRDIPDIRIRCIVPWYPSLDYTRTREERRETLPSEVRKDHELPAIFTDLFDQSYLHPPKNISLDSPYLSPGVAPTELLRLALPQDIIMHTCEYDMLLEEGEAFRQRLVSPPLNKTVHYKMVEGVPHGWDKAPNPLKPTPGVREHYLRACKEMRLIFGAESGVREHPTETGQPSAARKGSIQVVR
ncbi:hypothetical protein LTR56_007691 [Elasticomyces elasticus]|nr:hypothetical protein LTR56_007691 [Elasticomyces elasticus]KAK3661937.1 hypothetical protein LTR22_007311 [Elasticomyces elasticus]KAK4925550.1 hypothetical protein LTR49_007388 [Elasticomyces elasticus]KAK5759828.1 hypothetical protein LTS12_010015 [Elasticomyces elasticus]